MAERSNAAFGFQCINDDMARHPPRATRAYDAYTLYRVWKEIGSSGSTLCAETIERQVFVFVGQRHSFVRYNLNYQCLHDASEFAAFMQQEIRTVTATNVEGHPYDPERTKPLPFVIDWEEPECAYSAWS